jgi:hypothetical protein
LDVAIRNPVVDIVTIQPGGVDFSELKTLLINAVEFF